MKLKLIVIGIFFFRIINIDFAQSVEPDFKTKLDFKIDSMRAAFNFPAVAYGVIQNDSIVANSVLGYRNIETHEKVGQSDYFHIGSNTKSFTALLAGRLVEKGFLEWETKFFTLFPELLEKSDSAYYSMNLEQLLSHRARLINFRDEPQVTTVISEYERTIDKDININRKRYYLVKHILTKKPLPFYAHCDDCYSNAGYIAAALMLEKVSRRSWEELIMAFSDELKLDLKIGVPVSIDRNQPRGHINPKYWNLDIDKDLVPISDQLRMYHSFNQFGLLTTPSGNISITTEKFLSYLGLYLKGIKGEDNYLKSETYRYILSRFPKYSNGWWVDERNGEIEYAHRGSNGTFYSFAGIFPERNLGIVVMINTYSENGLTEIIRAINNAYK